MKLDEIASKYKKGSYLYADNINWLYLLKNKEVSLYKNIIIDKLCWWAKNEHNSWINRLLDQQYNHRHESCIEGSWLSVGYINQQNRIHYIWDSKITSPKSVLADDYNYIVYRCLGSGKSMSRVLSSLYFNLVWDCRK